MAAIAIFAGCAKKQAQVPMAPKGTTAYVFTDRRGFDAGSAETAAAKTLAKAFCDKFNGCGDIFNSQQDDENISWCLITVGEIDPDKLSSLPVACVIATEKDFDLKAELDGFPANCAKKLEAAGMHEQAVAMATNKVKFTETKIAGRDSFVIDATEEKLFDGKEFCVTPYLTKLGKNLIAIATSKEHMEKVIATYDGSEAPAEIADFTLPQGTFTRFSVPDFATFLSKNDDKDDLLKQIHNAKSAKLDLGIDAQTVAYTIDLDVLFSSEKDAEEVVTQVNGILALARMFAGGENNSDPNTALYAKLMSAVKINRAASEATLSLSIDKATIDAAVLPENICKGGICRPASDDEEEDEE